MSVQSICYGVNRPFSMKKHLLGLLKFSITTNGCASEYRDVHRGVGNISPP